MLLLAVALHTSVVAANEPGEPETTQEKPAPALRQKIARWVRDLGSTSFERRDRATYQLIRAGRHSVEAVAPAAESGDREVALRALRILQRMASAENPLDGNAAVAGLHQLSRSRNEQVAGNATNTLTLLRTVAHEALRHHGVGVSTTRQGGENISTVNLSRWRGDSRLLIQLRFLDIVQTIDLSHGNFSDDDLRYLTGFHRLEFLNLRNTQVGDAGLKEISTLKALRRVDLKGSRVGDDGMAHLAHLPVLRELNLSETEVSDAGLEHLAGLKYLELLYLTETDVTGAGLRHLTGMPKLKTLWLNSTDVDDAGLTHLAKLTELTTLGLSKTRITDGGLPELFPLKNLRTLWLTRTEVTRGGVGQLQTQLPQANIYD